MTFLYQISIWLYGGFMRFAALFNVKAKLWVDGRKELISRLPASITKAKKLVWFHCASLGEFEQGRPLIETIRQTNSNVKILVTFFSPSGYEIRKNYTGADHVCYLPLDTKQKSKQFINAINPDLVVFVKYEFWFNHLREIKNRQIPLYLVSAIFRKKQSFFRWYGAWYRKMLQYFTHIFVQDQNSVKLLANININNASHAGDTRFDRVVAIADQSKEVSIVEQFKNTHQLIVAGSTWEQDETLLAQYMEQCPATIKLVIAPHEIDNSHINKIEQLFNVPTARFTNTATSNLEEVKVLIIDNIGYLSSIYKYADVAYVGGAFKTGLHNVLEPAAFGVPVIFGPVYNKFSEAVGLIAAKGAFSIQNYTQLKAKFEWLFFDKNNLKQSSELAGDFVKKNCGATQVIDSKLKFHYLD